MNKMTVMKRTIHSTSLDVYAADTGTELELRLVTEGISAGFPSPALDFVDQTIDLNKQLVRHPSATFYGRVKGLSLKDAGIDDEDLLVIDRSLEPQSGKIAVCYIDGEFTAKRIDVRDSELWLMPENDAYPPIKVEEDSDFVIWGIVTHVIKSL